MRISNNSNQYLESFNNLKTWIERNHFAGYDPYDGLRSPIFKAFAGRNRFLPLSVIQINKKSPINFRPLLMIKRGYNPKALGLLLYVYSRLYILTNNEKYRRISKILYSMLVKLKSRGYSGSCWGYNFDYETPIKFVSRFTPSIVVTAFVIKGMNEYYKISKSSKVRNTMVSSKNFIMNDLDRTDFGDRLCFSYTPVQSDLVHNANLLGAETLSLIYSFGGSDELKEVIEKSLKYSIRKQNKNGSWYYRIDPITNKPRKQIDFHQGYILDSISNCVSLLGLEKSYYQDIIAKGLNFYLTSQFKSDGSSYWRWPRYWPIEIHNQSQGIITLCKHSNDSRNLIPFAEKIAKFTISNMQSRRGYFYYQKWPIITNKIPYMRWSQAWMLLALFELMQKRGDNIEAIN